MPIARRSVLTFASTALPLLFDSAPVISAPAAVDVRDFGAKGDGKSDDTNAIQRAIDFAALNEGPVHLGNALTYVIRQLRIRAPVALDLCSSKILLSGHEAGIYLMGSIRDFSIRNGTIEGDGKLESGQVGVITSGVSYCDRFDNFLASDLTIGGVVNGLRLDGITNARISRIKIKSTVGTLSGKGYGIAFGTHKGCDTGNTVVEDCEFERTTRHGFYLAGGHNITLRRLTFRNHAEDATETHYRSACAISRSHGVRAEDLTFIECKDECLGVDDDAGGNITNGVTVTGVKIIGSPDIAIRVALAGIWAEGSAEVNNVTISDVDLELTGPSRFCPINIAEARHVTLERLRVRSRGPSFGRIIQLSDGPFLNRENVVLKDIVADIPADETLIRIPSDIHRGKAAIHVENVRCPIGTSLAFVGAAEPTNANMRIRIDGFTRTITGISPSVAGSQRFLLRQTKATIVSTFTHAFVGQTIEVVSEDGLSTLRIGIFRLRARADRPVFRGERIVLRWDGAYWDELPGPARK